MKTLTELFDLKRAYEPREVFVILAEAALDGHGLRDASDFHQWFLSLAKQAETTTTPTHAGAEPGKLTPLARSVP